jgi:hypothetical protein
MRAFGKIDAAAIGPNTTVAYSGKPWRAGAEQRGDSGSVTAWSGALLKWEQELSALKARLAPAFGQAETRTSANAFIDGLLSEATRKTGWQLAEQAGLARPYRMQSLLNWANRCRRLHGSV